MTCELSSSRTGGLVEKPRRQFARVLTPLLPAVIVFAFLTGLTIWVAATADFRSFYSPMGHFSYAIGWSGLALFYPVLVVAVYLLGFTERLRQRWIFYARPRVSIRRYLAHEALKNAAIAFAVFFAFALASGVVVFYIIPATGVTFDTIGPGTVFPSDAEFARLTELTAVSPLLYVIVYAAWQGLNAAVWATFGFAAVLLIRNRLVALATPFLLFIALAVLMGMAPSVFAQNAPWLLWFLFSIAQVSMVPSVIILGILAAAAVGLVAWVLRHPNRWETLR